MPNDETKHETVGNAIRHWLERKGWNQTLLASVLGIPNSRINELIQGKRLLDAEMAVSLASAFQETTPEFWMTIDAVHRLSLVPNVNESVKRRTAMLEIAPVKEMEKRGWIPKTETPEELEKALLDFFDVESIDQTPSITVSTRRVNSEDELTRAQIAWCCRARNIASSLIVSPYEKGKINACFQQLRKLAAFPQEARKVPSVLSEFGIRFVIVEPIATAKIDGAAFWLDDSNPVIAVSVRYDRFDAFWFTVFHELSHIKHEDSLSVDSDLVGEQSEFEAEKTSIERRADNDATAIMVPPEILNSFITRVSPMYSKERIIQFANKVKIHPGIIVGQLQHRGEIGFHANREMLVKVRSIVTSTAVTDGWGQTISRVSQ